MFFDNFMIFLNVLEQFAIRVTIFEINIEDTIKYVNKLYFNYNDYLIQDLIKKGSNMNIDPKILVKESLEEMDKKIINDNIFKPLEYTYTKDIYFRLIY